MTQWTLLALLGLVLFASNSTMRPINMCPEKFLPSCGTWRTIVTDRKVFAQVRIFPSSLSLSLCFSSFLCSFFTKAENLSSKNDGENALGRSDWSPSFAYHCPFSFKLCLLLLLPRPRLRLKHNERNEQSRESKFKGNGRQRKILSL